ncbi:MAG: hypothetical protein IPI37_06255 [Bacteroidales bacterium]|nr:hypothetical protein [Bacteroidales bacterium]
MLLGLSDNENETFENTLVLSGNSRDSVKPGRSDVLPVKNPVHQADTLRTLGHEVDFFFIKGRGLSGYLRSIPLIRRKIKNEGYDVIHAHYVLTAFCCLSLEAAQDGGFPHR